MKILLNLIGIAIYFINRYANRSQKKLAFDYRYWLKDNWPEMTTVLLLDAALMILLFAPGTEVNFDDLLSSLPIGIKISGSWLMSFLLGLGLSSLFYRIFKAKVDAKT
jgi:hypothetical protein